jgi:hypothetical protein
VAPAPPAHRAMVARSRSYSSFEGGVAGWWRGSGGAASVTGDKAEGADPKEKLEALVARGGSERGGVGEEVVVGFELRRRVMWHSL